MLQTRIGDTGDGAHAAQQLHRIGEVLVAVGAGNLEVERRGLTEVQDLADDVGGQEGELRAGEEPRQLLAQRADIIGGGRVILGQADIDVAVLIPDEPELL